MEYKPRTAGQYRFVWGINKFRISEDRYGHTFDILLSYFNGYGWIAGAIFGVSFDYVHINMYALNSFAGHGLS